MITISHLSELRTTVKQLRSQGKRIGFVPTMGNLHEGHISLVKYTLKRTDYVISSIFVNPLQFGANEDLDKYPRTLAADKEKLSAAGNHALFTPTIDQIYPHGLEHHTKVIVPDLTSYHCGASRPGHFDGVSTVVNILFNMVQPDLAVFGEKDFQQLAVIRKMAKDLNQDLEIEGCLTIRDTDGLAKSSRNGYLTDDQRQLASTLYQTLAGTAEKLRNNENDFSQLEQLATTRLSAAGFKPDYFNIVSSTTLAPAQATDKELVILAAAYLGNTRLIDNIYLTLDQNG